ncbi:MAG: hypothetical protein ACT4NL_16205 [Pseudomarimonas sp.]
MNVIPSPQLAEPQIMIFSATTDEARQPLWLLGLGQFIDAELKVEVTLGGAESDEPQRLRFAYRGCGRLGHRPGLPDIHVRIAASDDRCRH